MATPSDRVDLPDEIDVLLREETHNLVTAARLAGAHVHYCALVRAALSGRLASIKIAGKRLTSVRCVREWLANSNAPRDLPPPARRRGRRAKPTTSAAERAILEARGLPSRSRKAAK